jgi:oligopeptide/dipeptide ABC transporter ATP-binding protein
VPLIVVWELKKYFPVFGGGLLQKTIGQVRAVDGVSFSIDSGKTFGLVGESGCGKSTTANLLLRLEAPTHGRVYFQDFPDTSIYQLSRPQARVFRRSVQAVFQDPWGSLDPRMTVETSIAEPLRVIGNLSRAEIRERVADLLVSVGLSPAMGGLYPHEFSGGQRQRIGIARALSVKPRLVVLDEPIASLDVSVQAQVLNLLKELQERHGLSYLLIGHHLGSIRFLSQRVGVMYLGKLVEEADSAELFARPLHPYSQALLSAALPARPKEARQEVVLAGDVPSPIDPPSGCRFRTRCPYVMPRCSAEEPLLRETSEGHRVACHLVD